MFRPHLFPALVVIPLSNLILHDTALADADIGLPPRLDLGLPDLGLPDLTLHKYKSPRRRSLSFRRASTFADLRVRDTA